MEEYQRRWKESIDDPYQFWGQIAKEFHWKKEPTKEDFVNYNFNVNDGPIKVHTYSYKYRTRVIISRALYIFTPFLKTFFLFARIFFSESHILIYG